MTLKVIAASMAVMALAAGPLAQRDRDASPAGATATAILGTWDTSAKPVPVWRAGANVRTQLKTELPIVINGTTVPPGSYPLFIDRKPNNWTLDCVELESADTRAVHPSR